MTYQVGIGIPAALISDSRLVLDEAASQNGYEIEFGIGAFWAELQESIAKIAQDFDWEVGLIRGEGNRADSLLAEELAGYIRGGPEPRFFQFLLDMNSSLPSVDRYCIFFADEWRPDVPVRVADGRVSDLIGFLRAFKDWEGYRQNPSGRLQQGDHDVPLFFILK